MQSDSASDAESETFDSVWDTLGSGHPPPRTPRSTSTPNPPDPSPLVTFARAITRAITSPSPATTDPVESPADNETPENSAPPSPNSSSSSLPSLTTMSSAQAPAPSPAPAPAATTTPQHRIGGSKKVGSDDILFSGGGCLPHHRIAGPASSMAYRPDSDLRSIMRVEEACTTPLDESKRIDEGSSAVTFTQWTNDVKRHFVVNGLDSIAYILKPKTKGTSLPDINVFDDVVKECDEFDLFTEWGVLSKEDMDAWEAALATSLCPMDATNSSYARRFLRSSVGPVLRERIDRELSIDVSGSRLLFFIIRKLQAVSSISGRQLVEELQQIRLTAVAGCHVQDCAQKIHNVCIKLVGLGSAHVPSDLPMLVCQCFDHTGIQAFDLEKTQLESALDEDPAAHTWTSILETLTSKFDKLLLTKRWPPLSTEKGQATGVSAFAVQLAEVKKGLNDVKSVLGNASRSAAKPASERDLSQVECNYCHKKGHYKSNCPSLAAKSAPGTQASTTTADAAPKSEKTKHWSRVPPADTESPTKTVTTDGKSAVFKWCKHCRRWRSGPKAHLTEQHRKKGSNTPSGHALVHENSGGINFGLFTGATDTMDSALPDDFVNSFFASHSVEPTQATEGAEESDDIGWTTVGPGEGTPINHAQVHPKVIAGQW
jgi:hypothetical protein